MQHGMLHAAVIQINRKPLLQFLHVREGLAVLRVCVAQEIPGRSGPVRHCIRFALGWTFAGRAGRIHPLFNVRERGLAGIGRLVLFDVGQLNRKLVFRNRDNAASLAMHDRNRLAPVMLAREDPVAEFILDGRLGSMVFFQVRHNRPSAFPAFHLFILSRFNKLSRSRIDYLLRSQNRPHIHKRSNIEPGAHFFRRNPYWLMILGVFTPDRHLLFIN